MWGENDINQYALPHKKVITQFPMSPIMNKGLNQSISPKVTGLLFDMLRGQDPRVVAFHDKSDLSCLWPFRSRPEGKDPGFKGSWGICPLAFESAFSPNQRQAPNEDLCSFPLGVKLDSSYRFSRFGLIESLLRCS